MISKLNFAGKTFTYYALPANSRLPFTLRILLESLLRHGKTEAASRLIARASGEIPFFVSRVLLQDFTGVPLLVDLAAMRDAAKNPEAIEPLIPVDLVIDHSVQVDQSGSAEAFAHNLKLEYARNQERYAFLKWGSQAFKQLRIIPPGAGIVHQVNLEYLAPIVAEKEGALFFDTVIGTDSHTTMVNGLGVLGWGVGGIEAEAAMLGIPVSLALPEVVGVHLRGTLSDGVTATDLALHITEFLRGVGVVNQFVEFFGAGASHLSVAERTTISNMAPEYGATVGFFPSIRIPTIIFASQDGMRQKSSATRKRSTCLAFLKMG